MYITPAKRNSYVVILLDYLSEIDASITSNILRRNMNSVIYNSLGGRFEILNIN